MFRKLLSFCSDSAVYGASGVLGQVIGLFMLPVFTHYLSEANYGANAQLLILSFLYVPLAQLGMPASIFRHFQTEPDPERVRRLVSTALFSVIGSSIFILAIGVGASPWLTRLFLGADYPPYLTQLTLLSAAVSSIGAIPQAVLRSQRRVYTAASINIVKLVATITATAFFVIVWDQKVLGLVLGMLVGNLVTTLALWERTHRSFQLCFDYELLRSMLAFGLPLVPHRLQGVGLDCFSTYVLYRMLGDKDAGLYNVAAKFAVPLSFAVGAMQQAWVPFKYQVLAEDEDPKSSFRSMVTYYFAGVSYLWVGVCLWGPECVIALTDPKFHSCEWLIAPIALIYMAQGTYFMLGTGLELSNDTRRAPLVSGAGLIAVIGLSYLLVPMFGAGGAAITTTVGWFVMAFVLYSLSQRAFPIRYDWGALASFTVCSMVWVGLGKLAQGHSSLVFRLLVLFLLSCTYPILLAAILTRSRYERDRVEILKIKLRHWFRSRKPSPAP